MRMSVRVAAGAFAVTAAVTFLTGCTSSDSGSDAKPSAAATDAAAAAEADGNGVGVMAPASPVVADINNLEDESELEIPVAQGQPVILMMEDPDAWSNDINDPSVVAWVPAPGDTDLDAFPRLDAKDYGDATVVLSDGEKTVTLVIRVVEGPGASAKPEANVSESSEEASSEPSTEASTEASADPETSVDPEASTDPSTETVVEPSADASESAPADETAN